jgi:23S rRNA (uridine2552-2'-O)-methyltransferase
LSFKVKDHYYKKAKSENFLARSVYKLEEIQNKYNILSPKDDVLDLGYYPGSWTQFVINQKNFLGSINGVDIQPVNETLNAHERVNLFQRSIDDIQGYEDFGRDKPFDLLLSDMAPKTTGVKSVDQLRSLNLVELVFFKASTLLKEGGNLVVKVFDSGEAQTFLKEQRKSFTKLAYMRPKSTRKVSKEFFVIGIGYKNL